MMTHIVSHCFQLAGCKKDGKFYLGLQSNQEKFAKEADEFIELVLKFRQLKLLIERRDVVFRHEYENTSRKTPFQILCDDDDNNDGTCL